MIQAFRKDENKKKGKKDIQILKKRWELIPKKTLTFQQKKT